MLAVCSFPTMSGAEATTVATYVLFGRSPSNSSCLRTVGPSNVSVKRGGTAPAPKIITSQLHATSTVINSRMVVSLSGNGARSRERDKSI